MTLSQQHFASEVSNLETVLDHVMTLNTQADEALDNNDDRSAFKLYQQVINLVHQLPPIPDQPALQLTMLDLYLQCALAHVQHAQWLRGQECATNVNWALYECVFSLEALRKSGDFRYVVVSKWHIMFSALLLKVRNFVIGDAEAVRFIDGMLQNGSAILGESYVYETEERIQGIELLSEARILVGVAVLATEPAEQRVIQERALDLARGAWWHFYETNEDDLQLQSQQLALRLHAQLQERME